MYPLVKTAVDVYYALETALISDEKYYTKSYEKVFGHKPDLQNPTTFTGKNNWLKLHQRE